MKNHKLLSLFIISIFLLTACGGTPENKSSDQGTALKENKALELSHDDSLVAIYKSEKPEHEIIKAFKQDLNGDGKEDLLVIYKLNETENRMQIMYTKDSEYLMSNVLAAPVENQSVQYKDIDEKDPLEFIVTGSKKGKVGYGIYRLEKGKLIDLFGSNMRDCC